MAIDHSSISPPNIFHGSTPAQGFAKSKDPLAAKNLYREMRSERVPRLGSDGRDGGYDGSGGGDVRHVMVSRQRR